MSHTSSKEVKKSLYIFLASLLGIMLFLVIHKIVAFIYYMLLSVDFGTFGFDLDFVQILALDYFTLILALMVGAWYGIWVGMYWYERVYEEGSHKGVVHHISTRYWPQPKAEPALSHKIAHVRQKLEEDLVKLETLTENAAPSPVTVKRRVVRKRVVKK